jgi:tetratricopeptide (TPR) repeat protein
LAAELRGLGAVEPGAPAPARALAPALTATERRLLSVVLIGDVAAASPSDTVAGLRTITGEQTVVTEGPLRLGPLAATMAGEEAAGALERLAGAARAHGGELERLVSGAAVITLAGGGSATDQAVQAARCALAVRAILPESPMALATGRGVLAGRWPVGEAIDRAAGLVRAAERGDTHPVRLDEVTAGLLDMRFDVGGDRAGLYLRGERDVVEAARTLLGRPTPCVGRDRELGALVGLFEECVAEPVARVVLVTGPAGVGKSRVRYELLRKIRQLGPVEVWFGRGDPLSAGSPFALLGPALRRTAGVLDGEPLELRRAKLRARVARHAQPADVGRVAAFLGELVGAPFPDEGSVELRAARQDALLLGDQMRRAWEDLLEAETAAQPLVLVLEDLHWGDLPTVKFVDAALRRLADRPLLVLAMARPEVREIFPTLWSERGLQEIRLGELTRRGAEKLVRQVLGQAVDDGTVAKLVERSGGNAFYLEELIRAVADGKRDAMPETVLAVVQARLERLEGDARRVLRAASVFGQSFWAGGVMALTGSATATQSPEQAREWLDELVEREVIAARGAGKFPGEAEYMFRHALVREAAYAMLTDADRALGHRLAAEWLTAVGESDAAVVGEHFERGGEPRRAVAWYTRAAEQALGGDDFRAADARAERGVACGASGHELAALRRIQAEARKWTGDLQQAARAGLEAMRLAPPSSALWFGAANELAEASGKLGNLLELDAVGEVLRGLPEGSSPDEARAGEVVALASCAFQLYYNGRYELAHALLDRIERSGGAVGDGSPGVQARVYQARSARSQLRGDAGAYLETERAALACFERAGDLRNACLQRANLGYACLEIGAYDEAESQLRAALDGAKRMGLSNVAATAQHNLGRAIALLGRVGEAIAVEADAVAALGVLGDRRLAAGARLYLSQFLLADGRLDEADREAQAACAAFQPPLLPIGLATRARIARAHGAPDEALAMAREAMALLERLGGVEEGESVVRLELAEALRASGQPDAARVAIRRARERLLGRAMQISDAEHRRGFLERVPEHARTLALAHELLGD